MENNVSPHKHSIMAMRIIQKLIIAKLVSSSEPIRNHESNRSVAMINEYPNLIEVGAYSTKQISIYKIARVDEISNNFNRVVFEDSEGKDHHIFSKGLGLIWKHFVVVSNKNQVARYYTVCQTLHSEIYKQYLDAVDSVLTGSEFKRKYETIEQIWNETSNSIELFMKFYMQSKNGITKQISRASENNQFIVSGIFGKGINFDNYNINGSNLIVVGGTGILPFIDLFAYLARRLLSKRAEMSQVFFREEFDNNIDGAKFTIYAFYPDRTNAVGIEFCEKISQLFLHFGQSDDFEFNPLYSRNGNKKLSNQDDLLSFIGKFATKTTIKNIFVCGPPHMNNLFQRHKGKILKEFSLKSNQLEII